EDQRGPQRDGGKFGGQVRGNGAGLVGRGGGADDMGNGDQRHGHGDGPGGAGPGQQQAGGAGRQRRADPPELAGAQIGRRHAGQFGREAIGRGQREGDEAGNPPEEPIGKGDGNVGEHRDGAHQQREAGGDEHGGEGGVKRSLDPILGRPFLGVVL